MLKLIRLAALAGIAAVTPFAASAEPLKVVASFSIIGDFAKNVGGDRIQLTTLVGPDGDAHVYEPKPADAAAMSAADLVLVNGLGLEGFISRLVEASSSRAILVEVSKGAELIPSMDRHSEASEANEGAEHHGHASEAEQHGHDEGHGHDHAEETHHAHGAYDPHAWQSVRNAETYVKNIADAFCTADSEGCDSYKANAESYLGKLRALDQEIRAAVASVPQDKRVVITSHDAFGYFEHAYGIDFRSPEGVSTESEASAADVAALIRQVRDQKASAIFVENITNARLTEQIARETGLTIGGTLYSDALSGEDGPASTYIGMMRHNTATIRNAVLGS